MARKKYTMLDVLEDWAKIQPNEKCLLQDDKIITYQERFQLNFFRVGRTNRRSESTKAKGKAND